MKHPKTLPYSLRLISLPLLSLGILCSALSAADRPNVVIIYGDDVGFGDVGVNGSKLIPTPNIDRLAANGINFTDGHCTASTCTPSRFSLLTGIHAFRYNAAILKPDAPLIIPTDNLTLGSLFKRAGYTTSIVGKWHLGLGQKGVATDWNADVKPGPLELGFDDSFLVPSTNDRVPTVYLRDHRVVNLDPTDPLYVGQKVTDVRKFPQSTQYPDGEVNRDAMTYYESSNWHNHSVINGIGRIGYMAGGKSALWDDETISDTLVVEAEKFIDENKDDPFFLFFSSPDIHVPRAPHARFLGATPLGYRGDAMVQFDWAVGAIMASLEKHGLTENTLVIFTSDNGPTFDDGYLDGTTVPTSSREVDGGHDPSGQWRGGKGQIWEAGTRVPLIVSWPDNIKPGTSDALVSQVDLLASLAALLDQSLTETDAPDSRDTLAAFLGQSDTGVNHLIEESRGLALRSGNWKYIRPNIMVKNSTNGKRNVKLPTSLYNLDTDPMEQKNLAEQHPEMAQRMATLLTILEEGPGLRQSLR